VPVAFARAFHPLELVDAHHVVAVRHRSLLVGSLSSCDDTPNRDLDRGGAMEVSEQDTPQALEQAIAAYNDAWNGHDLDAIMAMHAPDMVFANHTAGESATGEEVREHIGSIFTTWPDIEFSTRRLYLRDGLVVQEWTASATHGNTMRRGDLVAEPTGSRIEWDGLDVIPFENGQVKRKDVYSDSVSILRQVGLLD
jgi:steroid delta-isomerase-like uncharacterized protein